MSIKNIHLEAISNDSPYLPFVKLLWRTNSATLGFFPDGAFEEYAAKRNILVAIENENKCIGYLLYRSYRGRVITIQHLCVNKAIRGQGIAKKLVDHLKTITKDHYGIKLSCRRDFDANKIWPKLGFVAQDNILGKNKEGKELTVWWFDYGHANLFTIAAKNHVASKLKVVIDANIFFDLNEKNGNEESKALQADWLQDSLDLCITDELFNEINRNENAVERREKFTLARNRYECVNCQPAQAEKITTSIRHLFPEKITESDQSDLNQLAKTIASEAQFFVTRDINMLKKRAEQIYESYGVSIVNPAGLISKLDEFRRETEYKVSRFAGTLSQIRRVHSGEETVLPQYFQTSNLGETKVKFQQLLRHYLSDPEQYICQVALDKKQIPLALIVYEKKDHHELRIPMFRVKRSPLAGTLARYLIFQSIILSSTEHRMFTKVTDPYLEDIILTALQEDGFFQVKNEWLKTNLAVLETTNLLANRLLGLGSIIDKEYSILYELSNMLKQNNSNNDSKAMTDIEQTLWPAKIADANIPTFIVPIKAWWAHHLFDKNLANQTLFGAKLELAFNRESVYYRSKHFSGGLKAPGRILWYISYDPKYHGTKHIRACSRLEEITIGQPKTLFKQFRRLGVYTWENVFSIAKKDNNQDIMAIHFSDTELFTNPIPLKSVNSILIKFAYRPNFQSPLQVSNHVFNEIYSIGQQLKLKEAIQ